MESNTPNTLDYHNPIVAAKPISIRRVLQWTLGTLGAIALLLSCLLPSHGRARERANRVKCASNLKQLATAIFLYANENRSQMPPDWPTLYATQGLVPEIFVCPSCNLEKATGATTQQIITSMLEGDHVSYAIVNSKLSHWPDFVIAFEIENHVPSDYSTTTTGMNVLLNNGSVQFVDEPTAKAIRARYHAGVRPIYLADCVPAVATQPAMTPVTR